MGEITTSSSGRGTDDQPDPSNGSGQSEASQRVEHLIGELKLRSAELENANRELRRVSHYRSLFLARMSHELRTPLTSILGFSEILLDQEQLTDTQRRFCKKIQDSGVQLQMSLNQLVDLSRVESGPTELFLHEFSLGDTLRETSIALARFAHTRQVRLKYDLAPELTTVVSDHGKVRQILYIFLAWALSRSPAEQQVDLYADLSHDGLLRISINDAGEPIADLTRVFDPEETTGAREPDMNELGIIIGHRLLELMSGTVTVHNRDEGGLRVVIELPATPTRG
ncbi:MAG: HAMP domain-containing sensor histidine kinase [Acidobacteriota bacterium]